MSVLFVKYKVNLIYSIKYIESAEVHNGVGKVTHLAVPMRFVLMTQDSEKLLPPRTRLNLDQWHCNLGGESAWCLKKVTFL